MWQATNQIAGQVDTAVVSDHPQLTAVAEAQSTAHAHVHGRGGEKA